MSEEHYHALPEGHQLHEYRVGTVLGVGGFGITYLAWDSHLQKQVAIKEYLPSDFAVRGGEFTVRAKSTTEIDDYNWGLERFLQEAQTLARFRHRSIVQVYRFFEAHGTAYMVMDYESGESLSEIMRRQEAGLDEAYIRQIVDPLLEGLAEVHAANVLHRDIKPGNIIVRDDGSPVLLDFGAARDAVGRKSKSLTSIVTPGYAPLEQYYADGNQGPWTDIYAMGAILYQAVGGGAPPEAPARVRHDPLVPAVEVGAGRYSASFLQAIDWALAVDEEERPDSVARWRSALIGAPVATAADDGATMVAGRGVLQGERPSVPMGEPSGSRGGALKWVAAALALVLLAGGGGLYAYRELGPGTDGGNRPAGKVADELPEPSTATAKPAAEETKPKPKPDAEAEAKRQKQEAARQAEEDVRRQAEEAKRQAEAARQAEAKRQAEAEAKRQADEARRRAEAEAETKRQADEARRRAEAEAEAKRQAEESERRAEPQQPPPAPPPPQTANLVVCGALLPALNTRLRTRDCASVSGLMNQILEKNRTNEVGAWRSQDQSYSGSMTPVQTYIRPDGIPCRRFEQTVTVNGRTKQALGTACRDRSQPRWRIQL